MSVCPLQAEGVRAADKIEGGAAAVAAEAGRCDTHQRDGREVDSEGERDRRRSTDAAERRHNDEVDDWETESWHGRGRGRSEQWRHAAVVVVECGKYLLCYRIEMMKLLVK